MVLFFHTSQGHFAAIYRAGAIGVKNAGYQDRIKTFSLSQ
jgi:hypothetical protein